MAEPAGHRGRHRQRRLHGRTGRIADIYAGADPRVRVLHQENKGSGVTRQVGQELARGRYLLWLDADDFLDRDAARDMLAVAERDRVEMVCGNAVVFSDKTFNSRSYFHHPEVSRTTFDNPRYWKSKVLWRWIIGRDFIENAHVTHPPLKLGQDVVVMYELLCKVGTFSQCPAYFYYFRQEHKGMDSSLETEIDHKLVHFTYVRDTLVPAGRIKPLVKYLSENFMRAVRSDMPRILGREPHWERRVLDISRELFAGVEPEWLTEEACRPELRHDADLERFCRVMRSGDEAAMRAELAGYGAPAGSHHHEVDKSNAWHTFRRRIKAMFAPLSLKARCRQHHLRALATKRLAGVWSPSQSN